MTENCASPLEGYWTLATNGIDKPILNLSSVACLMRVPSIVLASVYAVVRGAFAAC
jgi:hypothetical protein